MTVVGYVIFAVPAGVIADKCQPNLLMISTDAARAVVTAAAGTILIMLVANWSLMLVTVLVALMAVSSCLGTLFDASSQRLIVNKADSNIRETLNSWLQGISSAAQLTAPAIVGIFVNTVGAALGLVIDALSYLCAAIVILSHKSLLAIQIERHEVSLIPVADVSLMQTLSTTGKTWDGFRLLFRVPSLGVATLSLATANLFAGVYGAAYVFFILRNLHLGGTGLAVLGVSAAVGGLIGSLLTAKLLKAVSYELILTYAPVGYAALFLIIISDKGHLLLPSLGSCLYSLVSAVVAITFTSYRQSVSPNGLAGRLAAATSAFTNGVYPLSAALAVICLVFFATRTIVTVSVVGESLSAAIFPLYKLVSHRMKT